MGSIAIANGFAETRANIEKLGEKIDKLADTTARQEQDINRLVEVTDRQAKTVDKLVEVTDRQAKILERLLGDRGQNN